MRGGVTACPNEGEDLVLGDVDVDTFEHFDVFLSWVVETHVSQQDLSLVLFLFWHDTAFSVDLRHVVEELDDFVGGANDAHDGAEH